MEWISVKDRFPEIGIDILVFRPDAKETQDPVICVRKYSGILRDSPQGVKHGFDCWCHGTHWMPLPPPPKELKC